MEVATETEAIKVQETETPVAVQQQEPPVPVAECLICGGSKLDEAMQHSEFTPNVLRCLLELLNLSVEDYEPCLTDITVCLNCGVKLRQIYVLHNQLIDIKTQLSDYRLQIENELVRTFMRTTGPTDDSNNSSIRRKIFQEIQIQISHSMPERSSIKEFIERDKNNGAAPPSGSNSPTSTEFEFDSNIPNLCDSLLEEPDQEIQIKVESDAEGPVPIENYKNRRIYSLPRSRDLPEDEDSYAGSDQSDPEPIDVSEDEVDSEVEVSKSKLQNKKTRNPSRNRLSKINSSKLALKKSAAQKNLLHLASKRIQNRKKKSSSLSKRTKAQESAFQGSLIKCTVPGCNREFSSQLFVRRHLRSYHLAEPIEGLASTSESEEGNDESRNASMEESDEIEIIKEEKIDQQSKTAAGVVFLESDEMPNSLTCTEPDCGKTFTNKYLHKRHLERHAKAKATGKKVTHGKKLKAKQSKSMIRMNSASGYVCDICGNTLKTKNAFGTHLKRHGGFRFVCKHCGKGFHDRTDCEAHETLHTGDLPFKCTNCDLSFRHHRMLRNHQLQKHEEFFVNGKSVFECESCKVVLSNGTAYKQHMMQHNGNFPYRCNICGNGQVSKTSHEHHMKTHGEERSFICSVCSKSFKFNAALVIHMRSHTGERPFQCKSCPKNYMDQSALRKHVRAVHNDGASSFVCHLCGKENPSSHYLTVHLRSHKLKEERAAGIMTNTKKRQHRIQKNISQEYKIGHGLGLGLGQGQGTVSGFVSGSSSDGGV